MCHDLVIICNKIVPIHPPPACFLAPASSLIIGHTLLFKAGLEVWSDSAQLTCWDVAIECSELYNKLNYKSANSSRVIIA